MTPKIDYALLGRALEAYQVRGYKYVEVPWMVSDHYIRATLPHGAPAMQAACQHDGRLVELYEAESYLVGSGEQGFVALDLPLGAYVGITPCFRVEDNQNLFYQDGFIKVELFVRIPLDEQVRSQTPGTHIDHVITDAREVLSLYTDGDDIRQIETAEGFDLMLGDVEIGSYGERVFEDQRWLYGTGLALPRFSVARALSSIV